VAAPGSSKVGLAAVTVALREVGVKEDPAGSNSGRRVNQYLAAAGLGPGYPWCAAFVTWCLEKVDYRVTTPGPALVENWVQWGTKHGMIVARPFRGDLVCYDWNADNWYDHIGFVVRVLALRWRGKTFAGFIKTVEGNTSFGNDSNGGKVMIRYRWVGHCQFLRVK